MNYKCSGSCVDFPDCIKNKKVTINKTLIKNRWLENI